MPVCDAVEGSFGSGAGTVAARDSASGVAGSVLRRRGAHQTSPASPSQPATDQAAKPTGSAEANWGQLPERDRFIAAMEKSGWVQAKAARILGLTPRQIGYALKKHGIEVKHL